MKNVIEKTLYNLIRELYLRPKQELKSITGILFVSKWDLAPNLMHNIFYFTKLLIFLHIYISQV
jgi:hypothetical protein